MGQDRAPRRWRSTSPGFCVARRPDPTELKSIVDFYEVQLKRFQEDKKLDPAAFALADPKNKPSGVKVDELAAWTTVARSMLNLVSATRP